MNCTIKLIRDRNLCGCNILFPIENNDTGLYAGPPDMMVLVFVQIIDVKSLSIA